MSYTDKRWWRTADGRLVEDGDPAAMHLAYGIGDEITEPADRALVEKASKAEKPRAKKAAEKPKAQQSEKSKG